MEKPTPLALAPEPSLSPGGDPIASPRGAWSAALRITRALGALGAFLACAGNRARSTRGERELAMPQLYMITIPGLTVCSDWAAVHDRLLDDFPGVIDVLATTIPATVLIVYEGRDEIDAWLDGISDAILSRRMSAPATLRHASPPIREPRTRITRPNHHNNRREKHAAARLTLNRSD